ncbi:hypothetical protein A6R68_20461, partial [Neotoma lepida]
RESCHFRNVGDGQKLEIVTRAVLDVSDVYKKITRAAGPTVVTSVQKLGNILNERNDPDFSATRPHAEQDQGGGASLHIRSIYSTVKALAFVRGVLAFKNIFSLSFDNFIPVYNKVKEVKQCWLQPSNKFCGLRCTRVLKCLNPNHTCCWTYCGNICLDN